MQGNYRYNTKTHTLHIYGFCPNSKSPEYKPFNTEDEAVLFDGRAVSVCKVCQKKRDKEINKK